MKACGHNRWIENPLGGDDVHHACENPAQFLIYCERPAKAIKKRLMDTDETVACCHECIGPLIEESGAEVVIIVRMGG